MTAMYRPLILPAALALFIASAPYARAFEGRPGCDARPPFSAPIAAAATRFRLPETLVAAVIAVESNGVAFAVSPKGAMGLMQLMPDTWAGLRLRYALGSDAFDPCDNIMAGTAYLRELLDRYGDPGFLAAYNAGPGRYESYVSGARPLPAETIAYVTRISGRPTFGGDRSPKPFGPDPDAWRAAGLFVRPPSSAPQPVSGNAPAAPFEVAKQLDARPATQSIDALFVVRTGAPK